jgi:hypothetical protein
LALQVRDEPQRDPLPSRLDVGATYLLRAESLPRDTEIRVGAGLVARLRGGGTPGLRVGTEFAWQHSVQVRGGYVLYGPTGSGPSVGFGVSVGKLQLDLARLITDYSSASGQTPTFVSLRYLF